MAEAFSFNAFIFDPYCENDRLTFGFGDTNPKKLAIDGELVDVDSIGGVWFRQKPMATHPGWSPLEQSAANFRQSEWLVALRHLPLAFPGAVWMNPVVEQSRISVKPNQLTLAESLGFLVPETRITNDADEVLQLFRDHDEIVYKCLYWASFADQTGVLTNRVTADFVLENRASISKCPGIFQRRIEKKHELRVTVVGDEIFSVKINTPRSGGASVDWRRAHLDDIFEEEELEPVLVDRLRRFQSEAGLSFGAYDLIVSPDDSVYFLECNPAGQYLWLKEMCGVDISPAILRFFEKNLS